MFFFKKKPLPRALAIALGKVFFGKNPENFFAEGQGGGPRQRFLKKNKKFYLPRVGPRQTNSKKKPFLCRGSALGKETANGAGAWRLLFFAKGRPGPRQRLYRVPDKGPSAKTPSPSKNSPRGLCRGQPSAKPLPRVSGPLPRAHASPVVPPPSGLRNIHLMKPAQYHHPRP